MTRPLALLPGAIALLCSLGGCVEGSRPDAELAQQARAWLVEIEPPGEGTRCVDARLVTPARKDS